MQHIDEHFVFFDGKVVATSTTRRQYNETLEVEPTEQELAIARLIRLEINDEKSGHNIYYKNKLVRAGITSRVTARRLAARIAENPNKFERERSGQVGAGEKAIENFVTYVRHKQLLNKPLHSPCRVLDPTTYAVIKTLPPNSSMVQMKSVEQKIAARERLRALKQLLAAE